MVVGGSGQQSDKVVVVAVAEAVAVAVAVTVAVIVTVTLGPLCRVTDGTSTSRSVNQQGGMI